MFLSCSLFSPQRLEAYTLLSERGNYDYQEGYKLYIKTVVEQKDIDNLSFGKMINIYYDDTMILRKIDEDTLELKPELVKYTEGPKTLFIFYKEPLRNILGVFASGAVAYKISKIIAQVTQNMYQDPLLQPLQHLTFALKKKEDEINKIEAFGETVEVRVSDIRDPYIANVWLKGSEVNHSDEYQKLIRDPVIGGKVTYMAINYQERTYYLFSDGRVFTRQASDKILQEIRPIFGIVQKLHEVGAVRF